MRRKLVVAVLLPWAVWVGCGQFDGCEHQKPDVEPVVRPERHVVLDTVHIVVQETLRTVITDTIRIVHPETSWTFVLDTIRVEFPDTVYTAPLKPEPDSSGTVRPAHPAEMPVELPNGVTMTFIWIEPGAFIMGSSAEEITEAEWRNLGRDADEGPRHQVQLVQGFYLGKHEVTQAQWTAVMGTQPWSDLETGSQHVQTNPDHPAVYISWKDAQILVHRLNVASRDSLFRLPSEAEWEYACRAGTTTRWSFGDDASQLGQYAWYEANAMVAGQTQARPVGTKLPNPWGLHDMHGNVSEWVQDWFEAYPSETQLDPHGPATGLSRTQRVVRGGNYFSWVRVSRSTFRWDLAPDYRSPIVGVRLVKVK